MEQIGVPGVSWPAERSFIESSMVVPLAGNFMKMLGDRLVSTGANIHPTQDGSPLSSVRSTMVDVSPTKVEKLPFAGESIANAPVGVITGGTPKS